MQTIQSRSIFRPLIALALLLAAGRGGVEANVSTVENDQSAVLAADQAWAKSAIGENADLFASYMTDDYVLLELKSATSKAPSHWVSTKKKDWVAEVLLQGLIATVSGEYSQTSATKGKAKTESGSYVETWMKRDGRWLVLNSIFP